MRWCNATAAPTRPHYESTPHKLAVRFLHCPETIGEHPRKLRFGRKLHTGRPITIRDRAGDSIAQQPVFRLSHRLSSGKPCLNRLDHLHLRYCRPFTAHHFKLIPVSFTIFAYLSDSERMKARNSAGVLPTASAA